MTQLVRPSLDAEKRREYEEDRKHVEEQAMEDHYIGTDIDEMEEIARNVPLSPVVRPAWGHEGSEKPGLPERLLRRERVAESLERNRESN